VKKKTKKTAGFKRYKKGGLKREETTRTTPSEQKEKRVDSAGKKEKWEEKKLP